MVNRRRMFVRLAQVVIATVTMSVVFGSVAVASAAASVGYSDDADSVPSLASAPISTLDDDPLGLAPSWARTPPRIDQSDMPAEPRAPSRYRQPPSLIASAPVDAEWAPVIDPSSGRILVVTSSGIVAFDDDARVVAERPGAFTSVVSIAGAVFVRDATSTLELDPLTFELRRTYRFVAPIAVVGGEVWFHTAADTWTVVDRASGAERVVDDVLAVATFHHSVGSGSRIVSAGTETVRVIDLGGAVPVVIAEARAQFVALGRDGTLLTRDADDVSVIERRSLDDLSLVGSTRMRFVVSTVDVQWAEELGAAVLSDGLTSEARSFLVRPGETRPLSSARGVEWRRDVSPDGRIVAVIADRQLRIHTFAPTVGRTSSSVFLRDIAPEIAIDGDGLDAVTDVHVAGRRSGFRIDDVGRIVIDASTASPDRDLDIVLTSPLGIGAVTVPVAVRRGQAVVSIDIDAGKGARRVRPEWVVACDRREVENGLGGDVVEVVLVPSHETCVVAVNRPRGSMRGGFVDVGPEATFVDIARRKVQFRSGRTTRVRFRYGDSPRQRPVWVFAGSVGGARPGTTYVVEMRCGSWRANLRIRSGSGVRTAIPRRAADRCSVTPRRSGGGDLWRAGVVNSLTGRLAPDRSGQVAFDVSRTVGRGYVSMVFDHGGTDASSFLAIGAPGDQRGARAGAGSVSMMATTASGRPDVARSRMLAAGSGLPGRARAGDRLGSAVARGDFDGDGWGDVAVGVPGARVGRHRGAGRVIVSFGGPEGPGRTRAAIVHQGRRHVPGRPGGGHGFGSALATADFDGDGRDDLVIGAPGARVGRVSNAGQVFVVEGGFGAGEPWEVLALSQTMTANERPERGDRFGAALDGFDADIVVGAPGESFAGAARRGVAHVFDGHGLSELQRLEFPGGRAGDRAGAAVAISDTHVVVGVPGHDRGGVRDVGAVGSWPIADGPVSVEFASQPWAPPRGLSFGASVTRVLFRSGWTFAVGAPGDRIRGVSTAGSVRFVGPRAPDGWIDRTASAIPGNPGRGDRFGSVLGFGIRGQLVVGAPGAGPGGSGAVFVAAADPDWILVHQDVPGIGGRASDRHAFGDAVAG